MNQNVQPHDLVAEMAVLGSILIDEKLIDIVTEKLEAEHFYKDAHAKIFSAMVYLRNKDIIIDTITLVNQLKQTKELESCGGAFYITGLVEAVPTTAQVEAYTNIVHEKAIARKMIVLAHDIATKIYDDRVTPFEIINEMEQQLYQFSQSKLSSEFKGLEELLHLTMDKLDLIHSRGGGISGLETGFRDLDSILLGFQPADLIVLAGRPSMGKSALAIQIASNMAKKNKKTAIFNYESSATALTERILYSEARIDSHRARGGFLSKEELKKLSDSVGKISEYPILINDMLQNTLSPLRSQARRVKSRFNVDLIIIDYLQKLYLDKHTGSRNDEVGKITTAIKTLAKELKIPILLLSQLSRAVEARKNKRPILSDLRESGNIEQDADVVIFLYRPDHYQKDESKHNQIAEWEIAKQRNGPTGTIKTVWRKEVTRFETITTRTDEN